VIYRFLAAEDFARSAGAAGDVPGPKRLVETLHRVIVRPDMSFNFGTAADGAHDLVIVPDLDGYNFAVLDADHTIGYVRPGAGMPLLATDMSGRDATDELFRITPDGRLVVTSDVMPVMMTTSVLQTQRDCLFYTSRAVRGEDHDADR
jgi:hypothetical protein